MSLVGKFPGVYPEITDLSQVVTSNSIVSCGYVGEAEFGPINKPVLVSNLRGYTTRFGELSTKYGYMGYSLAVAQDSINSHYIVRVVDEETARYAFTRVPAIDKSYTTAETETWFTNYSVNIDEMIAIEKDSNAAFVQTPEGQTVDIKDIKSVLFIAAENPNNKNYKIRITDSTINTNKTYKATSTIIEQEEVDENNTITHVKVTVPEMFITTGNQPEQIFEAGDTITITNASNNDINGRFEVKSVDNTYYIEPSMDTELGSVPGTGYQVGDKVYLTGLHLDDSEDEVIAEVDAVNEVGGVESVFIAGPTNSLTEVEERVYDTTLYDPSNETASGLKIFVKVNSKLNVVCYDITEPVDIPAEDPVIQGTRIQKYPEDNETTFSIGVYETIGKVTTQIENFQYCTLYEAKDNYGNSTFVEDVVNGKSDIIKVFVNTENENLRKVPAETLVLDERGRAIGYTYLPLQNGTSGDKPSMSLLNKAWELYGDRSRVDVSLLMNSGYAYENDVSYQNAMLSLAEKRRDCFCLFDIPSTISEMDDVLDWRQNINGMNTYRGALFTPWPVTFNSVMGKRNFLMCPSAYVAKIMGASVYPWIAPAGPNRGTISSNIVTPMGLSAYYDETTGGELYDKQLNCFIKDTIGYANWGQKTLQQKPTALDRINVARTVIYIETTLRDAARYHLFENNTAYERMQVTLQFSQFLDTVLNAEGIQRYQVICDESNNTPYIIAQNQLVIDIYLWPTYTTEFIQLNTIVMGPDAEVTVSTNS